MRTHEQNGKLGNSKRFALLALLLVVFSLFAFAPVSATAYMPVDQVLSSTKDLSRVLYLLNMTRNLPAEYPYTAFYGLSDIHSAGKFYDPLGTGMTGYGLTFNTTGSPADKRILVQANQTFWVSPELLTVAQDNPAGQVLTTAEVSPIFSSQIASSQLGQFWLFEHGQGTCWIHLNRREPETLGGTPYLQYAAICERTNPWVSGFDNFGVTLDRNGAGLVGMGPPISVGTSTFSYGETLMDGNFSFEISGDNFNTHSFYTINTAALGNSEEVMYEQPLGVYANTIETTSVSHDFEDGAFFTTPGTPALVLKHIILNGYTYNPLPDSLRIYTDGQTDFVLNFYNNTILSSLNTTPVIASMLHAFPPGGVDTQVGQMLLYQSNLSTSQVLVRCPAQWYVLPNTPTEVLCGPAGMSSSTRIVGSLYRRNSGLPVTQSVYNGTTWSYSTASDINIKSLAISDLQTGSPVTLDTTLLPDNFTMLDIPGFSVLTLKSYGATVTDISNGLHSTNFPIQYIVTNNLPPTQTNYVNNQQLLFVSYLRNSTGLFSLANVTVNYNNATGCVTQNNVVQVGVNSTDVKAFCSFYVPNLLHSFSTTFSYFDPAANVTVNKTLNETYYGVYPADIFSAYGVAQNSIASVWILTYDATTNNLQVKRDLYTCTAIQLGTDTINGDDICKVRVCPLTWTISQVQGKTVTPQTLVCQRSTTKLCTYDAVTQTAYTYQCGNSCEAATFLCTTNACNADKTGCSNEVSGGSQTGNNDQLTGFFAKSPLADFLINKHIDFTIAMILVAGLTAWMFIEIGPLFAAVAGGFLLLGAIVLTLPGGFLILLLIAAVVGIIILSKLFGGQMGIKLP